MANPYISHIGSATLLAGNTSVTVIHGYTMDDTAYFIGYMMNFQSSNWFTNITATQFTINFGSTSGYDKTIIWKIEGRGAKT